MSSDKRTHPLTRYQHSYHLVHVLMKKITEPDTAFRKKKGFKAMAQSTERWSSHLLRWLPAHFQPKRDKYSFHPPKEARRTMKLSPMESQPHQALHEWNQPLHEWNDIHECFIRVCHGRIAKGNPRPQHQALFFFKKKTSTTRYRMEPLAISTRCCTWLKKRNVSGRWAHLTRSTECRLFQTELFKNEGPTLNNFYTKLSSGHGAQQRFDEEMNGRLFTSINQSHSLITTKHAMEYCIWKESPLMGLFDPFVS